MVSAYPQLAWAIDGVIDEEVLEAWEALPTSEYELEHGRLARAARRRSVVPRAWEDPKELLTDLTCSEFFPDPPRDPYSRLFGRNKT